MSLLGFADINQEHGSGDIERNNMLVVVCSLIAILILLFFIFCIHYNVIAFITDAKIGGYDWDKNIFSISNLFQAYSVSIFFAVISVFEIMAVFLSYRHLMGTFFNTKNIIIYIFLKCNICVLITLLLVKFKITLPALSLFGDDQY